MVTCVAETLSFILTLAASRHVNLSSSYTRLNECMFSTLGDFLQVEKFRILRSNAFASNCFQIWKSFYGDFSDVATHGYGEDCLSRTQCHEWYQCFKLGRTSIDNDPKFGRPSTSMDDDHVEKVLAVIRQIM